MAADVKDMQVEALRRFLASTIASMQEETLRVPPCMQNVSVLAEMGTTINSLRSLLDNLPR